MLPRPPTSTLFPYTTLFRSGMHVRCHRHAEFPPDLRQHPAAFLQARPPRALHARPVRFVIARLENEWQDRKSTRLNSSHSQISYAVFCLKKKKKKKITKTIT